MVTDDFLKEADEWLNPLGYSIMSRSGDGNWANYVKDGNNPSIEVEMNRDNGFKRCKVNTGSNMKMLFGISTTWIQFKHPDIENFLKWGRRYNKAIEVYHNDFGY